MSLFQIFRILILFGMGMLGYFAIMFMKTGEFTHLLLFVILIIIGAFCNYFLYFLETRIRN